MSSSSLVFRKHIVWLGKHYTIGGLKELYCMNGRRMKKKNLAYHWRMEAKKNSRVENLTKDTRNPHLLMWKKILDARFCFIEVKFLDNRFWSNQTLISKEANCASMEAIFYCVGNRNKVEWILLEWLFSKNKKRDKIWLASIQI